MYSKVSTRNVINMASSYASLDDYEEAAKQRITSGFRRYYAGGADDEVTLRDSRAAFKRYRLRPRILRDVSKIDLSTTIQGQRIPFPVCIAPTAFHKGAHWDGELATAKAASKMQTLMVVSNYANHRLENVAAASNGGLMWMQMSVYSIPQITRIIVERAERSGYRGIVVTVDQPRTGNRRSRGLPTRPPYQFVNLFNDHESVKHALRNGDTTLYEYSGAIFSEHGTWKDVQWLKSITTLPVIIKGILTGTMAREAVQAGVDGMIVSAHGGRQLDGVVAPVDALAEVVDAVRGSGVEVYMDGGVRTGTDILKALALGAKAVFIGRPILWGLASEGEEGVEGVLSMLRDELHIAMGLMGCRSLKDVDRSCVIHESEYLSRL